MQVPTIKLSEASQRAAKMIINASKKETTAGQQMQMASYYAYLHSPKNAVKDKIDYAKVIMSK